MATLSAKKSCVKKGMNVYTDMNYERASPQMFELVDGVPEPKKAGPAWAWA